MYKKADTGKWSATPHTQRTRMISFLRDVIDDLEKEQEEAAALPAAKVVKRRRAG